MAGSLPRAVDADYYAELIRELRKLDVTTIVDTDGEPLRHAEPTVISPNVNEAEELVGHEFNDEGDMVHAVREMGAMGSDEAIMTAPDGCFACLQSNEREPVLMRARIDPREAVATVGSGDAFLAGFVAARYGGGSPEDCLRFGVACGAESIRRLGAGIIEPREVERLVGDVEVSRVTEAATA
jgi:1-phosphofructokinase/tagatose 6-phosphate kinase